VRTDLNFQFTEVRYKANDLMQTIKTKAAFVNGYYDINSNKNIVPYLTLSIGIGNNCAGSLKRRDDAVGDGKERTNFIWNIGAGAMFKPNKNLALDIGYKYMNLGHTKTSDRAATEKGGRQRISGHQIMGSLIYNFN
jgi:opacity protein-like surface antigen